MATAEPDRSARAELAAAAVRRLGEALDGALGDRLARGDGERIAADDWVRIGAFDLGERCLARWSGPEDEPYRDSTRTVARRIGRRALADRRSGEPVSVAVDRVLADEELWSAGLWEWWRGLDRAGRAAVRAAAGTWAVGALTAVGGRDLRWATQSMPADVPGRRLRLSANWDAGHGSVVDPTTLVVVTPAPPGPLDRYRAGFAALVAALGQRRVPVRVRHASPTTGAHRAQAVTAELLELAVDRVVDLAVAAAAPADAPLSAGPWCRRCHLLDACDEGAAVVGAGPVRA